MLYFFIYKKNINTAAVIIFFISIIFLALQAFYVKPIMAQQGNIRETNLQNIILNRCEQFLKSGKIEQARKAIEEANTYSSACETNPNYKRVLGLYQKQKKEYVDNLMFKTNNLFKAQEYEKCLELIKKIMIFEPENAQALDKLKICDQKIAEARAAAERSGEHYASVKNIDQKKAEIRKQNFKESLALIDQKKLQEAYQALKYALKDDASNSYMLEKFRYVQLLIRISKEVTTFNSLVSSNAQNDTCEIILLGLEKNDPDFKLRKAALKETQIGEHLRMIGLFYMQKKRSDKAETFFKMCLENAFIRDEAMYQLAVLEYEQQNYKESYKKIKTLYYSQNDNISNYSKIRSYYYELVFKIYHLILITIAIQFSIFLFLGYKSYGVIDYAFDNAITRVLTFRLNDARNYFERGAALFNNQNYSAAIKYLQKSIYLDSSNIIAHQTLGIALFKNKKYEEAQNEFEIVLKILPNHQRAAYYMAIIYDYQKRYKDALNMLEVARGLTVDKKNYSVNEIEKNKHLYMQVFSEYKQAADKILNFNENLIS